MAKPRLTDWGTQAKKLLKGKEPYSYIFEDKRPIAYEGERDSTLFRLVGSVIANVSALPGTTPEHIYALLFDSVADLGGTDDGDLWLDELWDMIARLWVDTAKDIEEKREAEITDQARIVDGYCSWAGETGIEEISRKVIVATGKAFYLLGKDGYYSSVPYPKDILISAVRQQDVESIIPTLYPKADGTGTRFARAQELIDRHSTFCNEVEGVAGQPGSYIRNGNIFCLNLYNRRTDLEPAYSNKVDNWLQELCPTKEEYTKLCNWLGNALAFDEGPICALSIKGPPGCGKKLLSQGLAECIQSEQVATSADFGEFASQLFKTPFLVINEGFPKVSDGMHPADSFRKLTAGDPIDAAKKFHDRVTIRTPLRIMLFANNYSVLRSIGHRRDLSPEDRDAIAMRIFHLNVPEAASAHLVTQGGLSYTRGWIRGDDGSPSNYVIAKHFLWLHSKREPIRHGARLLVEGELNPDVLRILSTQSGNAPEVIETIVSMIEAKMTAGSGVLVDKRAVFVTIAGVLAHHRNIMSSKTGTRLSATSISSVLNGLLVSSWDPHEPRMLPLPKARKTQRASWWKIKVDTLYKEAVDNGYSCRRLEEIVYGKPGGGTAAPTTLGDTPKARRIESPTETKEKPVD